MEAVDMPMPSQPAPKNSSKSSNLLIDDDTAGKTPSSGESLVPCYIEILGIPYMPGDPYLFQVCPRPGDLVALPINGPYQALVRFMVQSVLHVPDGADHNRPAFTVAFVKDTSVQQVVRDDGNRDA
jgi:hypothetical protein